MKRYTLLLLVLPAFLFSCRSIRPMRVQVMRPAEITVTQDIRSVAVLNRSIPSVTTSAESILTGEKPVQDKELSEECLRGLNELLQTSDRFEVKRCEGTLPAADPKSLSFAESLDWKIVDSLCTAYNVQALLVLEYFDTDFSIANPGATAAATVENVLNGNGAQVQVRGVATSNAGFRMYYPKTQTIIYQDHFGWKRTWTQESSNAAEAIARLIRPNQALMETSYITGEQFAMSIVPLYYWEDRGMYKGKKGEMERGERQALAKDWEGAVETWKNVWESSGKAKIRAKAAYNIALGLEVLGHLDDARTWVQKSYVEDGQEAALRYSDILDQRIREQAALQEQQSGQ